MSEMSSSSPVDSPSHPICKVVILAGPSGCGKTSLASEVGIPSLSLDNFYRNEDDPDMPYLPDGTIDWDDVRSWNMEAALQAITELCTTGRTDVPIYSISKNRVTGVQPMTLPECPIFVAEGIFSAHIVKPLQQRGLLADAVCINRSVLRNAWYRFTRDVGEARKPLPLLIRRGWRLAREEPEKVKRWCASGCRSVPSRTQAEKILVQLAELSS